MSRPIIGNSADNVKGKTMRHVFDNYQQARTAVAALEHYEENGWTYRLEHCTRRHNKDGSYQWQIAVFDETGFRVGTLGDV
jgi:hypothetical protein